MPLHSEGTYPQANPTRFLLSVHQWPIQLLGHNCQISSLAKNHSIACTLSQVYLNLLIHNMSTATSERDLRPP